MEDRTQEAPVPRDASEHATDDPSHGEAALRTLQQAMRRARSDDAERAGVLSDLRAARLGRLELLQDALGPLVAQIPDDIDLFDVALTAGASPRLFIDLIGFVEMGRDARIYRFVQDTRHGRTLLAESGNIDVMVDAVTDYVARRILERDKALAADALGSHDLPPTSPARRGRDGGRGRNRTRHEAPLKTQGDAAPKPRNVAEIAFAFLIDLLGSITFFAILAAIGWVIWNRVRGRI